MIHDGQLFLSCIVTLTDCPLVRFRIYSIVSYICAFSDTYQQNDILVTHRQVYVVQTGDGTIIKPYFSYRIWYRTSRQPILRLKIDPSLNHFQEKRNGIERAFKRWRSSHVRLWLKSYQRIIGSFASWFLQHIDFLSRTCSQSSRLLSVYFACFHEIHIYYICRTIQDLCTYFRWTYNIVSWHCLI